MEQERGLDRAAAIADMRFSFIQELVAQTVVKPHESKEQLRSNRIDKFLTGKYTAIPAFIAIMGLVFFLTFNVIGLFFQNLMEMGIDAPDRRCGHRSDQLERQRGGALAGHRRHLYRRGQRAELSAHHRGAVLLPLHAGGYRLHGACRLCDG